MNRIGLIVGGAAARCSCCSSSTLFIVDQRQVARGLRARRDQGSDHRAGPEVQAAAAVPERRLPRPPHPDARQPRDAADLHRREEEPGDRLAGQVAHHRPAPVHPQQRRRHAQPRERGWRRSCRRRSTRRSPSAPCAACCRPSATRSCRTCAAAWPTTRKSFGIEIVDVRIKRVDFVGQHHRLDLPPHGSRSASRSPTSCARPAPPRARRSAPTPTGSARSSSPRPTATRRRSRARATPRRRRCSPTSFGRDPQFAQFYRSLEAYRASFRSKSDVMVVDPSSDFFKAMRGSGAAAAAPAAPARK